MGLRLRTVVGLGVLVSGCMGPSNLSFVLNELPSGDHWLAVVAVDEDEQFVAASHLSEVGTAETLTVLEEAAGAEVYDLSVFDEGQLRRVGFDPADATHRGAGLSLASGDLGLLPAPVLVARMDSNGVRREEETTWPLSAPWAVCASMVGEGAVVSLSCESLHCAARIEQSGCDIAMRAPNCLLSVEGRVRADRIAFDASPKLGTCGSIASARGGLWSADCVGGELEPACRMDVFPQSLASPLEHISIEFPHEPIFERFLDQEFERLMPMTRDQPEPIVGRPPPGYFAGAYIHNGHLVVVRNTSPSAEDDAFGFNCPAHRTATFELISLETSEWVETATAPPCITQIVAGGGAPFEPEFTIALLGTNPRALIRLGLDGRPVSAPVPIPEMDVRYYWPQLIGPTSDGRLYLSGTVPPPRDGAPFPDIPRSLLFEIDASTLSPIRRVNEDGGEIQLITFLGPDRPVLVLGEDSDTIVDVRTGESIGDPRGACRHQIIPNAFHRADEGTRLAIAADSDDAPTLLTLSGSGLEECTGAPFPWFFAAGATIQPWAPDPKLSLVTVLEANGAPSRRRAAATLFDPHEARYVEGPLEIGLGPAAYPTTDPSGAVWYLLPWSNQVVRVRPRSGATIAR